MPNSAALIVVCLARFAALHLRAFALILTAWFRPSIRLRRGYGATGQRRSNNQITNGLIMTMA
jgi:hypothetical protein